MGASNSQLISNLPKSGIYKIEEEKEKIIKNAIGEVNFKELIMESLLKEFLKLFKENKHLFYCQSFLEGVSYEYGLFDKSIDKNKAFRIYKEGADKKNDYLCMYRMHRIFLVDYKDFDLERNTDLDKLYLYKCFAYLPYYIMKGTYYLLNKIDITYEIAVCLDAEDPNSELFNKFLDFLERNKEVFCLTLNDILLMNYVFNAIFYKENVEKDIKILDNFLNLVKGNDAYYEGQLKFCNFYLKLAGDGCDKEKVEEIFNSLIKAEYYKAFFDYGIYLMENKKIDEARNLFKKGADKAQIFCLGDYTYILLRETNIKQILFDYKFTSYILKNFCLVISMEKLNHSSFMYFIYYLMKYSKFKKQLQNDFMKFCFELIEISEKLCGIDNNEYIENNLAENYLIESYSCLGAYLYYGIKDNFKSDKEKALLYFKKAYRLAKEKEYGYYKRYNYLYIYKCQKYLFKNKIITLRKLNKTKEKLFMMYENTDLANLYSLELYNYYKLYKISVKGNIIDKLISLLKEGKKNEFYHHFKMIVYREKCKNALENEYSNLSKYEQRNDLKITSNDFNNNKINIFFMTTETNERYKLMVSKDMQFIKVIHKLYNDYPELEDKKVATYISQGNKVNLFDTIEENQLNENCIILMVNKLK